MSRIARRLEFMTGRSVKVRAKAGIRSDPESKNLDFRVNLQ